METFIVLALLLIAIVLFATEKLSVDVVTLLMLIVLTALQIITPQEAFEGFSSDFIIMIASIFVLSAALEETGILDYFVGKLVRMASKSQFLLLFIVMLVAGVVSAFLNNTTVTALFITPLTGVARKMNTSSSQLLMPLAYASILGGTCTLIGTSTNLAVNGYIAKIDLQPLEVFEVSPIGVIIFAVGIVYMLTIGKRLLPRGQGLDLTQEYNMNKYLSEILIQDDSPLIGQSVYSSDLIQLHFRILNIIRNKENFLPDYRTRIQAGDLLLVEGQFEDLMKVKETKGISIMADVITQDQLETRDVRLAEILVTFQSGLVQQTIEELDFQRRFGIVVLAISRHGETIRTKLGKVQLQLGDVLLVQGKSEGLDYLRSSRHIPVLDEFSPLLFKKQKGLITVSSFILAVVLGSLGVLPLSISFVAAAVVSVLAKCISTEKAYSAIDWRLLVLIGGMTAFGTAMDKSGAAGFLADGIVQVLHPLGVMGILAGFVFLTVFLTQPMSNAAAALVILPVAIQTAIELDVSPRTFAIAVMLAASVSLITPFEPSCILVYGPGKYRFRDFLKVGSGLTVVLLILILFMVPFFWPL